MIKNFIWSGNIEQRKICTVAWNVVCKPRVEGGLAAKDPTLVNKAFLLFLCWKMLTASDQRALLCREIFLRNGKPKTHHITSSV